LKNLTLELGRLYRITTFAGLKEKVDEQGQSIRN